MGKVIGVPVEDFLYEKMKTIAKYQGISLASLVRQLILQQLPELETKTREIQKLLEG